MAPCDAGFDGVLQTLTIAGSLIDPARALWTRPLGRHCGRQKKAAEAASLLAWREPYCSVSLRIRGVTKINNSAFVLERDVLRNSAPMPGMSPKPGTLVVELFLLTS
jgi:hypothetical protein